MPTTATTTSANEHEASLNSNADIDSNRVAPYEVPTEVVEDIAVLKEKLSEITAIPISHAEPTEASLYYDASTMAPLSAVSLVSRHRTSHPMLLYGR